MHQYFLQLTNNKYFLAGSSSLLNETGHTGHKLIKNSRFCNKWNPFPPFISVITLKVKFGEVMQKANTHTHKSKRCVKVCLNYECYKIVDEANIICLMFKNV